MKGLIAGLAVIGALVLPAVAQAAVNPEHVDFGSVKLGHVSGFQTSTFTNNYGTDVYLTFQWQVDSKVSGDQYGGFNGLNSGGCSQDSTLPDGQACDFDLQYRGIKPIGTHSNEIMITVYDSSDDSMLAQEQIGVQAVSTSPPPPARVRSSSLSATSFYPLVRDGYRDFVTYRGRLTKPAAGNVALYHNGRRIARWPFTARRGTRFAVRWNGRIHGRRVAPGRYSFRSHLRNGNMSGFRRVRVRTGWRYHLVRHTLMTSGYQSVFSHSRCRQSVHLTRWNVDCLSSSASGYVTFAHTFPGDAVVGTRSLYRFWYWYTHYRPRLAHAHVIGQTYYITFRVRPYDDDEFGRMRWAWKTRSRTRI